MDVRVVGGFGTLTEKQIATIEAIVCVVESGRTDKYDAIATMKGDTGGLSYGRHQASMGSGNLYKLVKAYCDAPAAGWAEELQPYLKKLEEKNVALNSDVEIKKLLRSAAGDPVMINVQDQFFFDQFMRPALEKWQSFGFETALSAATIYDSYIHGNFQLIAKRVAVAPAKDTERAWTKDYLEKRRLWLSTHSNTLLHATAIRIEALQQLEEGGNWDLALPFHLKRPSAHYPMTDYDLPGRCFTDENGAVKVRRCEPDAFGVVEARKKSGAAPGNQRDIFVQRGLIAAGFMQGVADGNFGPGTETAIKKFQKANRLKQTGAVGAEEFLRLCDAIEADVLVTGERRPDAGLKPAPEVDSRSGRGTAIATATGGAAAGGGAIIAGNFATDEAAKAAEAPMTTPEPEPIGPAPAEPAPAAPTPADPAPAGPATPPATTDSAPATPADTGPTEAAATPPQGAPVGADAAEAAPGVAPPPATQQAKVIKGKFCARTEALVEVPVMGCRMSTPDVLTVGAAVLFVVAVVMVAYGRRIFDRSAIK